MAVMFLAGAAVLHIHFSRCSQQLFGSKKDRELSKQLERDKEEKHEQQLAVHERKSDACSYISNPRNGTSQRSFEQAVRNVQNPGKNITNNI